MKQSGIIFSDAMVRAILDGRKEQTRRVVIPQPPPEYSIPICDAHGCCCWSTDGTEEGDCFPQESPLTCTFGKAGDRLWVRETFIIESNLMLDSEDRYPPPFRDGRPVLRLRDENFGDYWQQCHYRATDPEPKLVNQNTALPCRWRPPLFLPRWASRITLEIVNVRVERVQDIPEDDVEREGVQVSHYYCDEDDGEFGTHRCNPRGDFRRVWDSLNAKRGFGWSVNPFVWVIRFRKVESQASADGGN